MDVFHVAGDLVGAGPDEILGAFAELSYRTRRKSSDELRVDSDTLSFEIERVGA